MYTMVHTLKEQNFVRVVKVNVLISNDFMLKTLKIILNKVYFEIHELLEEKSCLDSVDKE